MLDSSNGKTQVTEPDDDHQEETAEEIRERRRAAMGTPQSTPRSFRGRDVRPRNEDRRYGR